MRVAFFALQAYPYFDPEGSDPLGGMERRAALFAKSLARNPGWQCSLYVDSRVISTPRVIDGVRLLPYPDMVWRRQRSKLVISRMVRPGRHGNDPASATQYLALPWHAAQWLSLGVLLRWGALTPASFSFTPPWRLFFAWMPADVGIVFGINWLAAEVVRSCRMFGRTSVVFLASDGNLNQMYRAGSRARDGAGEFANACHYALSRADVIIAQTEQQRLLLRERFGREAVVIRNPIEIEESTLAPWRPEARRHVLWVGRSDAFIKRPLLGFEVAKQCPEIPFLMVVNRTTDAEFETVVRDVPTNVKIVERVAPQDMLDCLKNSRALLNTSSVEGTPNTFLQAGLAGTPIVSVIVDPDGMLSQHRCGLVGDGKAETTGSHLRRIWQDDALAVRMREAMFAYLVRHHSAKDRTGELQQVLSQLGRRPRKKSWIWRDAGDDFARLM